MAERTGYRQGDVLILAAKKIPQSAKKLNHLTLAEGEVTGHFHRITSGNAALLETPAGQRFLDVSTTATLTHEEHAPITVDPGVYDVRIQREFEPKTGQRRVVD